MSAMSVGEGIPAADSLLVIDDIGGNCPIQATGTLAGRPFYFRARGEHWSFSVADERQPDPVEVSVCEGETGGFYHEEEYGSEAYAAGWMQVDEALAFIAKAAKLAAFGYERPAVGQ